MVIYYSPYIPDLQLPQGSLASIALTKENLSLAGCVVIATDHSCYDWGQIVSWSKLVFDTRGVTRGLKGDNIVRLGE